MLLCVCVRDCVITLILPLIGQKKTFSWVYSPWDSMNPQESPPICPLEALGGILVGSLILRVNDPQRRPHIFSIR